LNALRICGGCPLRCAYVTSNLPPIATARLAALRSFVIFLAEVFDHDRFSRIFNLAAHKLRPQRDEPPVEIP
jgi:hypothetical protein